MDYLLNNLLDSYTCNFLNKKMAIGLSGGIDSVVLLHLLVRLRQQLSFTLEAVHINHGISENANKWELFCITLCKNLNVKLHISHNKVVKLGGQSLENIARNLRYRIFNQIDTDVIVLAHHKNDQIETLLSQILRGTDIHNIAAMSKINIRQGKTFWRPLLDYGRNTIEQYAQINSISNIEDESNYDTKYLRNFVRFQLIPNISKWDPNIINKLSNVVEQMQNTATLIDELAQNDWLNCTDNNNLKVIKVELFTQLSILRQINLLNYFIRNQNLILPGKKRILEFCHQIKSAAWDRQPKLLIDNNHYLLKNKNIITVKFK